MKKLIAGILICLPILGFGQCVNCKSFAEASKEPLKAISIKMNAATASDSFEEIPDLTPFANLEILYITDFGFGEIPATIGSLKKLKELSFAGNELVDVPEELFELKQLKELILFGNGFSPESVSIIKERVKKDLPNTKLMIE